MLKRKIIKKSALVLSALLIGIWAMLGTNASLAWFRADDSIVNRLNFGNMDVDLYYKSGSSYLPVDGETKVFSEAALYEPGYTQIVYFKVENAGSIDFTYDIAAIPDLSKLVLGKNEKGEDIDLTDYLKYGFVFDDTEDGVMEKVAARELANEAAWQKLSNRPESGGTVLAGGVSYCALILYMPTEVENEANYRGTTAPKVEIGIDVTANQLN